MMSNTDKETVPERFGELAFEACNEVGGTLGIVLTMSPATGEEQPRVRVGMYSADGVDAKAGEDLMRWMVEAFKRWPDDYEQRQRTLKEADELLVQIRPRLDKSYVLRASEQGLEVRDTTRGSRTVISTHRSAEEVIELLSNMRMAWERRRTVEPREGEGPHGAGTANT